MVLGKFQIEMRFSIELHGEFKIVDDVMSTIIWDLSSEKKSNWFSLATLIWNK